MGIPRRTKNLFIKIAIFMLCPELAYFEGWFVFLSSKRIKLFVKKSFPDRAHIYLIHAKRNNIYWSVRKQSYNQSLGFLITFQLFDYPLTEIARNSGVSYSTLQIFWEKLESNKIVVKTRRVGKSDLYKLNTANPAVKQLLKLDWNTINDAE